MEGSVTSLQDFSLVLDFLFPCMINVEVEWRDGKANIELGGKALLGCYNSKSNQFDHPHTLVRVT